MPKLGHYCVGDLKVYSKIEAIELHQKTGIHPHWDFNDPVFSSYDWTVEPTDNILELYRKRARQLREEYDHIVLFWSGGADSETTLQSFISNDIQLDEIVSYSNYEGSGDKTDAMNSELFYRTFPQWDAIKESCPWMKYRVIDLTQRTMDYFENSKLNLDWIYNMNMMFSPNAVARDGLVMSIKEWADIVHSGKKLCILWGMEKPRIVHENNRYSFRFIDIFDHGPNVKSMAGLVPYHDELFFWTPDMPEIVIKQAHLVMKFLEAQTDYSEYVVQKNTGLAYKESNGKRLWLNNHGLHRLIYPNWNINTFDAGKPPSLIYSPRDNWFYKISDTDTSKMYWSMGIDRIFKTIPDYWKNDPSNVSAGLKACWSKDYYLTKD